jgi:hypothetical protein
MHWGPLAVPPAVWYLYQQGLAMTLRGDCAAAGVPLGSLWGAVSLMVCIGTGWWARPRPGHSPNRRFLALLATLAAGLFTLAILFQTLATLIIPPCAR